jgi:hypothetical protein
MVATSPGTVTFDASTTTDPNDPGDAGQSPILDSGLFGINDAICPSASTCDLSQAFIDVSLTIEDDGGNSNDPRVEVVIGPHLAFGNTFEGSIHGFKFDDLNGDGVRQPGEPPLAGVEIVLDWNDSLGVPRSRSTFTDDNGEY